MTCPECQGAMRTYERNGVHIDQCSDCRGLFLDHGGYGSYGSYDYRGKHYKKRKKNFLEELFD